jgi:hypothetical protein
LNKITDSTGITINYGDDNAGRPSSVTGSGTLYAGVSNYASNFQYRAWGGLEAVTDGKGYISSMTYNAKLQPTQFEISGGVVHQDYDYFSDGRMRTVHNTTDQNFDRSFSYDHAGRIVEAKSGGDVNGYQYAPTPYHETFGYDAFSNVTARQSDLWNGVFSDTDSGSYTNTRRLGWGYDADGRNTNIDTRTYTFDAVGRQTSMVANEVQPNGVPNVVSQVNGYDADGAMVTETVLGVTTYYLRSSALGGAILEEISSAGQKNVGYVYSALGTQLAQQVGGWVSWKHNTPGRTSQYTTNSANSFIGRTEFDPLGADVPLGIPNNPPPSEGEGDLNFGRFGALMDARWSDFHNLAAGCGTGVAAACSGHMIGTNLDQEMLAAFGYKRYDLPGSNNEMARSEERYNRHFSDGYDLEFQRYEGVTATYSDGVVKTNMNVTLDEYQQWETGYLPDSGTVNLENRTVTIYGGAQYFVAAKKSGVEYLSGEDSYGDDGQKRIQSIIESLMQNEGCKRAFEIVGLQTIKQTVDRGLVVGGATLLRNSSNNNTLGIVEGARQEYWKQFKSYYTRGGTIMQIPGQTNPFSSRDQRPRMLIAFSAFESGWLKAVIIHEFIHAGGQPPISSWFGHDLSNYEWYDFLQDSCK